MTLEEAKGILDGTIPHPQNKMVDGAHMAIAMAWQRVKTALLEGEDIKERYDTLMKYRDNQVEAIRRRVDAGTLTDDDRRLLDELCLPHRYDRRTNVPDSSQKPQEDIQHDPYKVGQLLKMLAHETSDTETHYGANLKHWHRETKPLTIDAGGIRALIDYYSTHRTDLGNGDDEGGEAQ